MKSKPKTTASRVLKSKDKYPYLFGCYVDDDFVRTMAREFLQGTVEIRHYKGAMLLQVLPERLRSGKHRCSCPSIQYPSAWLRGDDLDALIGILREAKKVWLRAYRKADRELARRRRAK